MIAVRHLGKVMTGIDAYELKEAVTVVHNAKPEGAHMLLVKKLYRRKILMGFGLYRIQLWAYCPEHKRFFRLAGPPTEKGA